MKTKARPWRHIYHDIEIPRPKSHDIERRRELTHDIVIPRHFFRGQKAMTSRFQGWKTTTLRFQDQKATTSSSCGILTLMPPDNISGWGLGSLQSAPIQLFCLIWVLHWKWLFLNWWPKKFYLNIPLPTPYEKALDFAYSTVLKFDRV